MPDPIGCSAWHTLPEMALVAALLTLAAAGPGYAHSVVVGAMNAPPPPAGCPNAEHWTSRRENGQILLTRIGFGYVAAPASEISLAEMATCASNLGLSYQIRGTSMTVDTLNKGGSAKIETSTGRVLAASGSLSGLAYHRLKRVRRPEGMRPFLTRDGLDFTIDLRWLQKLIPNVNLRTTDLLLPLQPRIADISDDLGRRDDLEAGATLSYSAMSIRLGPLCLEIKDVKIEMVRIGDRRQYSLSFAGAFTDDGRDALLVQPALLRPLARDALALDAVTDWPLGRPNTLDGAHGGLSSVYRGFRHSGFEPLAPTRILKPGESGSFTDVRLLLPRGTVEVERAKPIWFQYEDGTRSFEIELYPLRAPAVANATKGVLMPLPRQAHF